MAQMPIKVENAMAQMAQDETLYQALRLHGIGKLEQQDRKTLTRMACTLIEVELETESVMTDDLGEDATKEYAEQLEWIGVVYKAIDKLLSNG